MTCVRLSCACVFPLHATHTHTDTHTHARIHITYMCTVRTTCTHTHTHTHSHVYKTHTHTHTHTRTRTHTKNSQQSSNLFGAEFTRSGLLQRGRNIHKNDTHNLLKGTHRAYLTTLPFSSRSTNQVIDARGTPM